MTTFDNLQKHQILNCGDMKKDGKEPSKYNNCCRSRLFNEAARDIITGITL